MRFISDTGTRQATFLALVAPDNTAIVQEIYAAFARRDLDAAQEHLAEDVRWENPEEFLTPTLNGRDAVRAYYEEILAASATVELEPVRSEAAGDQVAVELIMRMGVADAPATEQPAGALYTIENGRVTRVQGFLEPERAFAMLPLSVMPEVRPIGRIESPLKELRNVPKQGDEGAPDALLVIEPRYADALTGLKAGQEILVLTWLDRADRDVLQVYPRGDTSRGLQGVFNTRSPARPNPIGLHRVTIGSIDGTTLEVDRMEAVDGTPILDVKPVIGRLDER